MPQPLSGPGVGLPIPSFLYPSELFHAPHDSSNACIDLSGGEALTLPAGNWYVNLGRYSVLQYQDPQTGAWRVAGRSAGVQFVKSDGFNVRVANLTGCPVGAVVTAEGSGYVQSTTSIVASAGNSTWQPIIGGKLGTATIVSGGSGFTIDPIVMIPGPPSVSANGVGGIQATGTATLTSGVVTAVTLNNVGAGYLGSTVTAQLLPSPFDPNIGNIKPGSVSFAVAGAGTLTGAICTNPGEPVASPSSLTLTVAGGGSSAAVTPIVLQAVNAVTVGTAGAGYPDSAKLLLTSAGGLELPTDAVGNPQIGLADFVPNAVQAVANVTSAGAITTADISVYSGGLFTSAPDPLLLDSAGSAAPSTAAVITFTMGAVADTVILQPAP